MSTSDGRSPAGPAMPLFVELETSRYCNRTCPWCPNGSHRLRREQELMPWPLFLRIVAQLGELGYAGSLALHNYNEPLANPRLLDELHEIAGRVPQARTSIFTNGDLLDTRMFERLVDAHIAHLRVTLYPALGAVGEADRRGSIRDWLRRKPFLAALDWAFVAVRPGDAARASVGRLALEIIRPDVRRYDSRGGTVAILQGGTRTMPCFLTRDSAAIDYRGRLKMCCNVYSGLPEHDSYIIGSLVEEPLLALWTSPRLQALRTAHAAANWKLSPICRGCRLALPVTDGAAESDGHPFAPSGPA
jgi:hypothetical protein